MSVSEYLERSAALLRLAATAERDRAVETAASEIAKLLMADLPLLVCGNGGSAADAMHIAGELVGRFLKERRAFNVICLSANPAVLTAWTNDYDYKTVFSRQVEAHGRSGGAVLGISTSGNSANVIEALRVAKAGGMFTVGLSGQGGGAMAAFCDVLIDVPSERTPEIQQVHLCLYHYLCERIETLCT